MGRWPCCDKGKVKTGTWTQEEDRKLRHFIDTDRTKRNWIKLPSKAGLRRCGKSCRLRWTNYLDPGINHGSFTEEEEEIIIYWHAMVGNKWSLIARKLEGRTDNRVKNHWNTTLKKKLAQRGMNRLLHQQQRPIQHMFPVENEFMSPESELRLLQIQSELLDLIA